MRQTSIIRCQRFTGFAFIACRIDISGTAYWTRSRWYVDCAWRDTNARERTSIVASNTSCTSIDGKGSARTIRENATDPGWIINDPSIQPACKWNARKIGQWKLLVFDTNA